MTDLASAHATEDSTGNRYRILSLIARGGMGSIYRAWDAKLDRAVAIKMLLGGNGTVNGLHRFHHEARIVAQLQHPNIPPIFDVGTMDEPRWLAQSDTDCNDATRVIDRISGAAGKSVIRNRPFLAMKLIHGHTLESLLNARGPGSAKWLPVFESICQAVGFAHQAGVVHRDLKPSNVMIGSFGEVQVMDWGLAKKLGHQPLQVDASREIIPTHPTPPGGRQTMIALDSPPDAPDTPEAPVCLTRAGSILGTPSYMSPEQARGENHEVDGRSDVFALGVILFGMLTGREIHSGKSDEVLIRRARGDYGDAIAVLDRCADDPAVIALAKRCLEFHPSQRPADAAEVARAVAQLRSDAAIRAAQLELRQAETELRELEQNKRRRVMMTSVVAVVAVLFAGITVSTVLAWRAYESERRANVAAGSELAANQLAQKQLIEIKFSNEILLNVFRDIDVREIREGRKPLESLLAEQLSRAGQNMDSGAIHDPRTLADLMQRLGRTLLHLGRSRDAVPLFEREVRLRMESDGATSPETTRARNSLAEAIASDGRYSEATAIWEDILGTDSALSKIPKSEYVSILSNMTNSLHKIGQNLRAIEFGEKGLALSSRELGPIHHETLTVRNNLATAYIAMKEADKAFHLFSVSLETLNAVYGKDHLFTILTLNNLGSA